eukprot:jgi/Picsp_1/1307/NSC_04788-R1_hypothetical protein CHLNCDRAFT_138601 [Chlorella variabilis]
MDAATNTLQVNSDECPFQFNMLLASSDGTDGAVIESLSAESFTACCSICASRERCNAWNFCSGLDGCTATLQNGTRSSDTIPRGECQLLAFNSSKDITYIRQSRVQFSEEIISGIVRNNRNNATETLEGYVLVHGANFNGTFSNACGIDADSIGSQAPGYEREDGCFILGDVKYISEMCNNDTFCEAFVFYPNGDGVYGSSFGVLKSELNAKWRTEDTVVSPFSDIYIRENIESIAPPVLDSALSFTMYTVLMLVNLMVLLFFTKD